MNKYFINIEYNTIKHVNYDKITEEIVQSEDDEEDVKQNELIKQQQQENERVKKIKLKDLEKVRTNYILTHLINLLIHLITSFMHLFT